jgi:phenylalanyl-tRNA synthetase beta chain
VKISLNWLRELCPVKLSNDEIARRLTLAGLEVEGTEERALPAGVVVARVTSKTPIEGSDHLNLCQVDDGAGMHQVVCGAVNYAAGDLVPMARPGAVLPGGKEIKRAKLRGVESEGMLCSARELGLGDDHSGLLHLPREAVPGTPLDALLGLPDTVLEVNVTPNRPDALSHLGIARELSSLTGVPIKPPAPRLPHGEVIAAAAHVSVEDPQRCPRYLARVLEGVKVGPSPLWLQERLRSCGIRPISNVVDATNLALLELGHPLHAFDLDQLAGARIVVRLAHEGEPLTTLDGKERKLAGDDLVITDGEKPIALAGVMGGQTSEVSAGTTRLLLESAVFEGAGIRRTARRHALHTEASHRYERGADDGMAPLAADRCAELIVQLAGGTVLPGSIDLYPSPRPPTHIWVRPARVSAILGATVDPAEVDARLRSLGLEPMDGMPERRLWKIPSWRRDLTREIDCVEEIARQRGLDTIPIEVPKAGVGETAAARPDRVATAAARAVLSARGFDEVLNYSFVAERDLDALWPDEGAPRAMRVANPLTVEQGAMRWSLLAGLLRNLGHNLARGARDLLLYELGRVYLPHPDPRHPSGPLAWPDHEPRRLALALTGQAAKRWTSAPGALDFYDCKGAIEDVLLALAVPGVEFSLAPIATLHPASCAALTVDGLVAGFFGQLHPQVAKAFDVPAQTFVAELDWELLLSRARPERRMHSVPKFPGIERDLAFVVDAHVLAARMLAAIRAVDAGGLLEQVSLFDVYKGAPVPEGKKSIAYRLSLRAADRTLTDAEADGIVTTIKQRLQADLGAEIRA